MNKKEKPMTVRYESDGDADGYPVYDMAYCPQCGREFEAGWDSWESIYCPECGQRLAWEVG
ncbi:MAG: hypothetical protein IJ741_07005 [Schwartzia sp.]|nr:hypothetical protein [Schwartzia sp. (in: firmicutes)]